MNRLSGKRAKIIVSTSSCDVVYEINFIARGYVLEPRIP